MWLPLERKTTPESMRWRQSYYLRVIARLRPGVNARQAGEDADGIVRGIRSRYPDDLGQGGLVVPLLENTVAGARGPLWILFGAVGFVLLIACANLANLNLGRAIVRRREIAVRLALGAARGRVIRQLFTESLVLALAGAAAGLVVAETGVQALVRVAADEIPRAASIHADLWVVLFALTVAGATSVGSGLLPALTVPKAGFEESLRDGGRANSASRAAHNARATLVVCEIALALVLMIGAGLMIQSFRRASAVDPGFDPRGLITMRLALSPTRYDSIERQSLFYTRLLDRLRELPEISGVGAIDGLPFADGGFDNSFSIEGRPDPPAGHPFQADIRRVDSGYFRAMRIPLIAGRGFARSDSTGRPPVVVISQSMARKYWPAPAPPLRTARRHPRGDRGRGRGCAPGLRF